MRKHFASGLAFIIVAVLSVAAGLLMVASGTSQLGFVFLIAAIHDPGRLGARIYGVLIMLAAATAASVSARHVWLQSLPEGEAPECGPSLDYMLDVFPLLDAMKMILSGSGECAEIVWQFLGLSMPAWVFICLITVGLAGLTANWTRGRGN